MRIWPLEEVSGRTIVVADLHGCYDEALLLLKTVGAGPEDRVIFVGDLVDRGPKPRECVDLAMSYGHCVLGNHEEKHLRQRYSPEGKLNPGHLDTRRALEPRHYEWLETLPLGLLLPEYNALVVHAGLFPDTPLSEQQSYHLLHIQHIEPPHPKSHWPSKAPASASFWTNHWKGPERVIFGHSVFDRPLVLPHAVGIDTGACFGGGLTALVLPEWRTVTVPSRDYSSGQKLVAKYPIQDGVMAYS